MYFFAAMALFLNFSSINNADAGEMDGVFKAYEQLHRAFFSGETKQWKVKGAELASAMAKTEKAGLQARLAAARKEAEAISGSGEREDDNKRLAAISDVLIKLMGESGADKNYAAFYCPMVKKYWIQSLANSSVVQNPYAPEMPNCGVKK